MRGGGVRGGGSGGGRFGDERFSCVFIDLPPLYDNAGLV